MVLDGYVANDPSSTSDKGECTLIDQSSETECRSSPNTAIDAKEETVVSYNCPLYNDMRCCTYVLYMNYSPHLALKKLVKKLEKRVSKKEMGTNCKRKKRVAASESSLPIPSNAPPWAVLRIPTPAEPPSPPPPSPPPLSQQSSSSSSDSSDSDSDSDLSSS